MIGKVIKYKFDNTAALNSVFRGRVYPLIGAQAGAVPFCVYDTTSIRPEGSKDADSHIDLISVEVTMVGTNYAVLQQAAENVRTAFVRMNETVLGVEVQSCSFDGLREQVNQKEETFAVTVDLNFRVIKT